MKDKVHTQQWHYLVTYSYVPAKKTTFKSGTSSSTVAWSSHPSNTIYIQMSNYKSMYVFTDMYTSKCSVYDLSVGGIASKWELRKPYITNPYITKNKLSIWKPATRLFTYPSKANLTNND